MEQEQYFMFLGMFQGLKENVSQLEKELLQRNITKVSKNKINNILKKIEIDVEVLQHEL